MITPGLHHPRTGCKRGITSFFRGPRKYDCTPGPFASLLDRLPIPCTLFHANWRRLPLTSMDVRTLKSDVRGKRNSEESRLGTRKALRGSVKESQWSPSWTGKHAVNRMPSIVMPRRRLICLVRSCLWNNILKRIATMSGSSHGLRSLRIVLAIFCSNLLLPD